MKNLCKTLSLLICIILLGNLSSCIFVFDPGPYSGNQDDLYALVENNIPGAPGDENATIEVIEKDSYGRILFRFSSRSTLYNDASDCAPDKDRVNLRAYVVCQKSSGNFVYYMENVCYLTAKSWDDFSDDILTAFKQANMWNQEPNEANWSVCKVKSSLDYNYPSEQELFDISGTSGENIHLIYDIVSMDARGRTLIFVRELYSPGVNQMEYYKSYVAISNENGGYSKEFSMEIEDFYNHTAELIAFKETVDWARNSRVGAKQ